MSRGHTLNVSDPECPWIYGLAVLSRFSHVQLHVTPWTVALRVPLSMGLSRQEYWSGLPFSSPGDLPDLGIKPTSLKSPALQADSLLLEPPGKPYATLRREEILTCAIT